MEEGKGGLRDRIRDLEGEILTLLHEGEARAAGRLRGARRAFERLAGGAGGGVGSIGIPRFGSLRPVNVLSAPLIYSMFLPLLLLDLSLMGFQAVCFRLYRIPRVGRSRYFGFDRHRLPYLNPIEKINCDYCAYATGVLAFGREILSRTEQYWCPVKHASRLEGLHPRHEGYIDYGRAVRYRDELEAFRKKLIEEAN
jgi:hypothetical protein